MDGLVDVTVTNIGLKPLGSEITVIWSLPYEIIS